MRVKILFATPCKERPELAWWSTTHDIRNHLAPEDSLEFFVDPHRTDLALSRNLAAHKTLVEEIDVLLFFDADQGARGEDLLYLCRQAKDLGAPVGAAVPLKMRPQRLNFQPFGEIPDDTNLFAVKKIGTGCLAIPRSILDFMAGHIAAVSYEDRPPMPGFFHYGTRNGYPYLEDQGFCYLCNDLEIPIYVDLTVQVQHYGTQRW